MKCIIFDLDGTLLYTLDDLYYATNYALNCVNRPKRTHEEIRQFVGNGIQKLIQRALDNKYTVDELNSCLDIFINYYSQNAQMHTKPYDGILNVLDFLKNHNISIAVNSNKYDSAVKKLCKSYFDSYINLAIGETNDCPKKPSPVGANKILKEFGCNKENAIYVGDSLVDIKTANNAGILCISVSWGYCNKDILKKNNEIVVDNCDELSNEIKRIWQL